MPDPQTPQTTQTSTPDAATTQLRNTATGELHSVPLSELQTALASGQFEKSDNSSVNVDRLGTTVSETPEQAQGTLSTGNESFVNPSILANSQTLANQRAAFNNIGDKALTFSEGMADALTFGLVHERSAQADVRRDVNSGSQWLGELTGIALGLVSGTGESQISELGEQIGKNIATRMFGSEGKIAGIANRALAEAGANAAISTAQATGHQVFNSLLEDKPLAAEAIFHEAGMGALLGAGFGTLGGLFAKGASKAAVESGINAPDFIANSTSTLNGAIGELDSTLATHQSRLNILNAAGDSEVLTKEFLGIRQKAFDEATSAREELVKMGDAEWALNATPKQASKWHESLENYNNAVERLDKVMSPTAKEFESITGPETLDRATLSRAEPNLHVNPDELGEVGLPREDIQGLNDHMAKSPELRARYEEIYGEPWQPVEQFSAADREIKTDTGEDNLGGKETETSSNETNPGARQKAKARQIAQAEAILPPERLENEFPGTIDPNKPIPLPGKRARDIGSNFTKADPLSQSPRRPITPRIEGYRVDDVIPVEPKVTEGASGSARSVMDRVREEAKTNGFARDASNPRFVDRTVPPADFHPVTAQAKVNPDGSLDISEVLKNLDDQSKPYYFANKNDRYGRMKNLLDNWWNESKRSVYGQPTPGAKAANNILDQLNTLNNTTGGRLDAVDALGMARKHGFGEANTELGRRFQQVWSINKLTSEAAEASRKAVALAQADAAEVKQKLIKGLGLKLGVGVGGAVVGNSVGGSKGALLGASLSTGYLAFTGRLSGAMSKILTKVSEAGEAILAGNRSTVIALGINKPWQYSDRGPIKDPVDRIQEIHHLATNPELIAKQITNNAGDLAAIHPETVQIMTKMAQDRLVKLSIRAPKFVWDKFGQPLQPGANALRSFLEYENSTNDLAGALDAFKSGTISKDSAAGFKDSWPSVHLKLTSSLLNDPDQLKSLDPVSIRNIETITGASLSNRDNGQYVARQQLNWQSTMSKTQGQAPQSFKINDNSLKHAATNEATALQSLNGRAPGN